MARTNTITKADKANAETRLRQLCPKGTTVYTVIRSVAKSGMSRRIDFYVIKDNQPIFITGWIANYLGYSRKIDKDGIRVDGCGMDMGFSVVYDLSATLYGDNDRGGYAINQKWL